MTLRATTAAATTLLLSGLLGCDLGGAFFYPNTVVWVPISGLYADGFGDYEVVEYLDDGYAAPSYYLGDENAGWYADDDTGEYIPDEADTGYDDGYDNSASDEGGYSDADGGADASGDSTGEAGGAEGAGEP